LLATTNKEIRESRGFALFDAKSFEPILQEESMEIVYREFTLTNDFLAYLPQKNQ
jgi:hypothetical protein